MGRAIPRWTWAAALLRFFPIRKGTSQMALSLGIPSGVETDTKGFTACTEVAHVNHGSAHR